MPDALPHPLPTAAPAIDWSERTGPISLLRCPASPAALELTRAVAAMTEPFLDRKRPLGQAGRLTHQEQTGTILAGLLKEGLRDKAVRAQRGHAGAQWADAPIGQDSFWQRAGALERAGLIGTLTGVAFQRGGQITGKATALWCAAPLLDQVGSLGLTADGFVTDWPLTAIAEQRRPTIAPEDLASCYEVPAKGSDSRQRCLFPADQAALVEDVQGHLERLNAHLAGSTVRGCTPPVLRRQFFSDVRLGGRLYAIGPEAYQSTRTKDRHTLRLDGQPVVEVDLRASALSILLALTGRPIPEDPYAVGPLAACDRETVKAWFVQTLNSGRPALRWSDRHSEAVRKVPIKGISAAAMAAYPEIATAPDLVPPDLLQRVPLDRRGWALGQWLVGIEAKVMEGALSRLMDAGVVALPLHDALLCREGDAEAARKALGGTFEGLLGSKPQVRIKACAACRSASLSGMVEDPWKPL